MNTFSTITLALLAALIFVWIGVRWKPRAFPLYPERSSTAASVPLPDGLPAPVARYFRVLYGDEVPIIESAVISGLVPLRVKGIKLQGRFRFTYVVGQGYRHYIETTIFGMPFLKVNEQYLDGRSRFEMPFGVVDNDAQVNQGANLGLWTEAIWFPAVLATDPRVRWRAVDDSTAALVVPFGEASQSIIVRFDSETGLLRHLESMRYKGAEAAALSLWINEALEWGQVGGCLIPTRGAVTWFGEGTPWAVFDVNDVVLNVDVETRIRGAGP